MIPKLTPAQRADLQASLPAWTMVEGRDAIRQIFKFADFSTAWGFMSRVALLAEAQDRAKKFISSRKWNDPGYFFDSRD